MLCWVRPNWSKYHQVTDGVDCTRTLSLMAQCRCRHGRQWISTPPPRLLCGSCVPCICCVSHPFKPQAHAPDLRMVSHQGNIPRAGRNGAQGQSGSAGTTCCTACQGLCLGPDSIASATGPTGPATHQKKTHQRHRREKETHKGRKLSRRMTPPTADPAIASFEVHCRSRPDVQPPPGEGGSRGGVPGRKGVPVGVRVEGTWQRPSTWTSLPLC